MFYLLHPVRFWLWGRLVDCLVDSQKWIKKTKRKKKAEEWSCLSLLDFIDN